MKCVELNKIGNFDTWEVEKLQELKIKKIEDTLGQRLLFENDTIRVWEIALFPQERLPFRTLNADFSCVSVTDGLLITRSSDGSISLVKKKKGEKKFMKFRGSNSVHDLENIGDKIFLMNAIEYKIAIAEPEEVVNSGS